MIDAAFDHVFVDPEPSSNPHSVHQVFEPPSAVEEEWAEPIVDEFGGDPVYDTGA